MKVQSAISARPAHHTTLHDEGIQWLKEPSVFTKTNAGPGCDKRQIQTQHLVPYDVGKLESARNKQF